VLGILIHSGEIFVMGDLTTVLTEGVSQEVDHRTLGMGQIVV
jgi:hypothetical protein